MLVITARLALCVLREEMTVTCVSSLWEALFSGSLLFVSNKASTPALLFLF